MTEFLTADGRWECGHESDGVHEFSYEQQDVFGGYVRVDVGLCRQCGQRFELAAGGGLFDNLEVTV